MINQFSSTLKEEYLALNWNSELNVFYILVNIWARVYIVLFCIDNLLGVLLYIKLSLKCIGASLIPMTLNNLSNLRNRRPLSKCLSLNSRISRPIVAIITVWMKTTTIPILISNMTYSEITQPPNSYLFLL